MKGSQHIKMTRVVLAMTAVAALSVSVTGSGNTDAASASASLDRLREGNARFVAEASAGLPVTTARRTELAKGQSPFAIVLSCADSRVPPEIVFNQGLGDLFVVRVAGQVADRSVLASVEYAAEHLHSPLLVVMGHEFCGADAWLRELRQTHGAPAYAG